jgi:hypothetical protein
MHLLPGVPLVESPFFERLLPEMDLSPAEQQVARALNAFGYAVIDFPDADILARIERIKTRLAPHYSIDLDSADSIKAQGNQRVQDAWQFDEDVKAIATNASMLDLLSRLYGRRAFPFQTLNFPVGTQQHVHSDSIHFSSQPERFMCGVWLAMEDIHPDAGPLSYCPGSHHWPILSNTMMGTPRYGDHSRLAQDPYDAVWDAMIAASGMRTETFAARKGQALIWAANLLHGGSYQKDPTRTRWSQVTHYYFADCVYYTPAFSEEPLGRLDLRTVTNIATGEIEPNRLFGREVGPAMPLPPRKSSWQKLLHRERKRGADDLPEGFDPETYLRLNPDVAEAGEDAASHYRKHGRAENRRFV